MSSTEKGQQYLEHYGVKGMQWGVRRSAKQLAKASSERSKNTRYKESGKKLTESELNARIKRMETEKKYNQLNSRTIGEGEAMARRIVAQAGEKAVKTALTGVAVYGLKKAISAKLGAEAVADIKIKK